MISHLAEKDFLISYADKLMLCLGEKIIETCSLVNLSISKIKTLLLRSLPYIDGG